MQKKKMIIAAVFLTLIAFTSVYTIISAVKSYQYDMDPSNGVDILEGFGSVLTMMVGGFVVFYELDLFYTVYSFAVKPTTAAISILNILSNLSLLLIFFSKYYKNIFKEDVDKQGNKEFYGPFAVTNVKEPNSYVYIQGGI